ncbi:molecular chaperone GrpE [Fistulifera solaris]|uniref:GrpE protein homolog n=1 Tax=Fistulifera solaris TaxID=1519565 RepID=A0A1Z5KHM1_FISSO|nr:molecular chaperone GrpE [Fistulifera solaris]|eukprot:GAX25717.1 molecular chaperone GrpE [Fistulifera solaris]
MKRFAVTCVAKNALTRRAVVVPRVFPVAELRRWNSTGANNNNQNTTNATESVTEELKLQENETQQPVEEEKEEEDPVPALQAQIKELKDQMLRSLAEQENTRRIAQRDISQAKQFAIQSFAKSLLETSDNLERALAFATEQEQTSALYEGVKMTENLLLKAFEKNGLMKFGAVGDVFDPNQHEALFEYEDANGEAGTVGQVMKSGFLLHSRVLRPAEVGVIKKTESS